ncbi:MAG: hypothetical protein ACK46C_15470 [Flavobacteriales bacterium]|jgi:hypothetical protein
MLFGKEVNAFLRATAQYGVRMLLVGGGAVNFHGYQRQSPDLDFWMEPTSDNFSQLVLALRSLGYEVDGFPRKVLHSEQNITLQMSPGLEVEVITFLKPGFTFDEAWERAVQMELAGEPVMLYRILAFEDLITSKLRSGRPKDLLDVQELKRRRT